MSKIINNFKKKQIRSKNWLEIWEKKGHNLNISKIEKIIEADGFSSALGTFNKQNWFEKSRSEHLSVRESIGLFDQTSFSKFLIHGKDALSLLNYLCVSEMDGTGGKIGYKQMLNSEA